MLSYLLSGIVQVELPRRQRLLEAETTEERLEELVALLDREVLLLGERLRYFAPDPRRSPAPSGAEVGRIGRRGRRISPPRPAARSSGDAP